MSGWIRFVSQTEVASGKELFEGTAVLTAEASLVAEDAGEFAGFGQHFAGRAETAIVRREGAVPGCGFGGPGLSLANFRGSHLIDEDEFFW